ncbi:MAG: hypothetical protein LBE35_05650 [Clostridiales bacterium]|jgi:hypothetical protein|nr:hypothetical protein [Clostridiales bacterium]
MEKRYFEGYLENGQFYVAPGVDAPRTGRTKAILIMLEEPAEPARVKTPEEHKAWVEKMNILSEEARHEELDELLFARPKWKKRDNFSGNAGEEDEIRAGYEYNNQVLAG